jgi:hypothetical protein
MLSFVSLGTILSFLTGLGGTVSAITKTISDLKMAKIKAESDTERAEINRQIEEAHDRRAVIVSQAGTRIGSFVIGILQLLAALPMIAILWKYAYDKIIGGLAGCAAEGLKPLFKVYCQTHYRMDPLDQNIWWIILTIVAFLFMGQMKKAWTK